MTAKSGFGGITPALQAVIHRAQQLSSVPFGMYPSGGGRTKEEQAALTKAGWSKTMHGAHLGGFAGDLIPIINGQPDPNSKEGYATIHAAMMQASQELGIPITAGADYKGSFKDPPHYEVAPQVAAAFKADPNVTYTAPQSLDFTPAQTYELGKAGYPGIEAPSEGSLFSAIESKYNLPSGYLTGAYGIESNYGKNLNVSSAGARGPFQFIPSTAAQYGLNNPNSLAASADAAARLASDNAQALRTALGREPTSGELYLAHQQGALGAIKLLSNPDMTAAQALGSLKAVAQNLPAGMRGQAASMTAKDFGNFWTGQFDQKAAGIGAAYGVPSAVASASPVDETTLASLDMGGIPGKFVTDTQAVQPVTSAVAAQPVAETIAPADYGLDQLVTAAKTGEPAKIKAAVEAVRAAIPADANPAVILAKAGDYIKSIPKMYPQTAQIIKANFQKNAGLFGDVPYLLKPTLDRTIKSVDAAPIQPVSFSPSLTNGAWGLKSSPTLIPDTLTRDVPGSIIPEAQSEISRSPPIFTGFDAKSGAGSLFGGGSRKTGGASDGAGVPWFNATPALSQSESSSRTLPSRSYDVPSYADPAGLPTQPTSPYGKSPPAAGGPAMGDYAQSSLVGALAKLSPAVGGPAMGGYVPPAALPLTAGADPVAKPLSGVTYMPPEADAKPAYTMAPKPQAPVRQISYRGGPIAGARLPVAGQGSMGGVGLGAFAPTIANVISAARGAGYTTGVASPGYTSSPAYQAAMSHGYSAPNFSKGSGGAIYAYHPDGNGGGTYVNSFGKTMTY